MLRVKDGESESKAEFKVYPADVMTAGTTLQAKISQGMFPNLGKVPKHWPCASRHLGLLRCGCREGCGFRCLRFVSCGHAWSFEEPKVYALRPRCC